MLNDAQIIRSITQGDIRTFEQIFRQYYVPLTLYAYTITGRRDTAEEVIQELFYKLWRDREKLRILSLKNYLYGAVRNQALQLYEHGLVCEQHKQAVLSSKEEVQNPTPHEELEYKELEAIINRTLEKLPERCRSIFSMHRHEGLKYKEIAEHLSLSVKTIEAEMTKAYQALREEVERFIIA